ncbi:MAG: Lrp/AsnC family transcriptional regulator [Novosphingobium sp.]|nr:Lrp/AsnC family transcriptional regulator [Novosphingobium sp.]
MQKLSDLDVFDRRLIELVRQNNLAPARELADTVGLSISAVLRRLRRLREDGVIIADIAVVNPALTGSALTMHVLVRMKEPGRRPLDDFSRRLSRHREVTAAWEVTGDDDFVLKVQVGSMEEYDAFTREALSEDAGVLSFKTMIVIRTIIADGPSSRALADF